MEIVCGKQLQNEQLSVSKKKSGFQAHCVHDDDLAESKKKISSKKMSV
jgi:hypothetical protein